jgi:methyl-accepting chemotaxis protein
MKIGFKLTLAMMILSFFIIGAIGLSLLIQARKNIASLAHEKAVSMAGDYAADVAAFFTSYWYTAQTAARIMEDYKSIDVRSRRPYFNNIVRTIVENDPAIGGVWCIWEPDALEGNDQLYLDTEYTNEDGRFAPYWYRDDDDEVVMEALDDFDHPDEDDDYYRMTKRRGSGAVLDPYADLVGGELVVSTTIAASIYDNGRIVGAIGIDLSLDAIQEISQLHKPFGVGLTAVFSNDGSVVGHFDLDRIGKNMEETEVDMAGPHLDDMIDAVRNGEVFSFFNYVKEIKTEMDVIVSPINIGESTTPWSYAVAVPNDIVMRPVRIMEIFTIIISIIIIALVVPMALMLARTFSKPIVNVAGKLKDISEGEGDLTQYLEVKTQDEFGELALYFNQTLKQISALISRIKYKVNALTNTGHELTVNMKKTSKVIDEIAVSAGEMKTVKSKQEKSAAEADNAVKIIQTSIDTLHKLVEEQSESVETSSSAIEEMIANIHSVTGTLAANNKNVGELSEASENGKVRLQKVAEKIQEIAKDSEGLLEINSVMKTIASQTNLLSMNAAIEAAHAGDSGRGFAVVADEIRKLAISAGDQSKTTTAMLKKIKESIDSITLLSNDALSRFEVIDKSVKTVSHYEQTIHSAMKEQETGGQLLLRSMERLKELSVSVGKGSEEMTSSGGHLIKQTNELISNSNEAINGMNEVLNGAMQQIQTAVNQVDEMSIENSKNFEDLKQETEKFKTSSGSVKKEILVVDDDETYLMMADGILETDYEVFTVKSGKEALQLFYQGLVPNLVLLDLVMPGIDGWDTFERIRGISNLHNVPIAFCSASSDRKDIDHAKRIGAVDYIQKPCDDLLARVSKLV